MKKKIKFAFAFCLVYLRNIKHKFLVMRFLLRYVYFTTLYRCYLGLELSYYQVEDAMHLIWRGIKHDWSKFLPQEVLGFAHTYYRFKNVNYGTPEYNVLLKEILPTIERHYRWNSHHPEHYENGYDDMSKYDKIEMLADWSAAAKQTKDGNIWRSIDINSKRFNIPYKERRDLLEFYAEIMNGETRIEGDPEYAV